ncbi:hypothetical protein TRIP_E280278 [uncultured Spirochaetota bacterium]|nr:hypothetical protein TRIP_E280278 [uncultured Spirochaetota bacterium]
MLTADDNDVRVLTSAVRGNVASEMLMIPVVCINASWPLTHAGFGQACRFGIPGDKDLDRYHFRDSEYL